MAIPSVEEISIPMLEMVSDGREYRLSEITDLLAEHFSLTAEERIEREPSGEGRFRKHCQWAESLMTDHGLLESTQPGYHRITERGLQKLRQHAEAPPNETEEERQEIVRPNEGRTELRENRAELPILTEEAIRRIVREEINRAKEELKKVLSAFIFSEEGGSTSGSVGSSQQDEGFSGASGFDNHSGRAAATDATPANDLGASDGPGSDGIPQSLDSSVGNSVGRRDRGNSGNATVGLIRIGGNTGSATHTRPVTVRFGGRSCAAHNQSWKNLLARVCESLGVPNFNRDTPLSAEVTRRVIVNLINRHTGIQPEEIHFDVYRDRN
ncbi:MAG: winged helix-turn-helix domain-containing protein [Candidatus Poribacteria bacterium]|nr:winged helix-turn-helix domain-containing protein [Candidatus Poribacteria bacterium]